MKTVQEIIDVIKEVTVTGPIDVAVSHITADSREVKPGSLFICLTGAHVNGHDYIAKAIEAGAVALLVSQPVAVPAHIAVLTVGDRKSVV